MKKIKKVFSIFSLLAFAFAFSTSFASAYTGQFGHNRNNQGSDTKVTSENNSSVCNTVSSGSNTGDNMITATTNSSNPRNSFGRTSRNNGYPTGTASIVSGQARSFSVAGTLANNNETTLAPQTKGDMTVSSLNNSSVVNNVSSGSNTGGNTITGNGNSSITTGNSSSTSAAITIVNSNMTKI